MRNNRPKHNGVVLFCFVLFCFWLREKGGDGLKPDGVGNYLGAVRGKNVKRRPPAGAHFQLYPKLYSAFPLYVRNSFPSIARTSDPDALIKFPPFGDRAASASATAPLPIPKLPIERRAYPTWGEGIAHRAIWTSRVWCGRDRWTGCSECSCHAEPKDDNCFRLQRLEPQAVESNAIEATRITAKTVPGPIASPDMALEPNNTQPQFLVHVSRLHGASCMCLKS